MLNSLNQAIYSSLNELSLLAPELSRVMRFLSNESFLKGGLIMGLFWGLWFSTAEEEKLRTNRETIIAIFFGAFLSMFLARVMAVACPFVVRPINDPNFIYSIPFRPPETWSVGWSSFPSDHAALFSALAAGLWFISRPVAALTMMYVIVVVFIPRVYLGYHYPIDIIAGMIIGIAAAVAANIFKIKQTFAKPFVGLSEKYPGLFYFMFFIFSFQVCTLFDSIRRFGSAFIKYMHL